MKLSQILRYFFLWQLLLIIIVFLAAGLFPLQETYLGGGTQSYLQNPLLNFRANFDGIHYLSIAQNGYGYAQQAFFPLYPNLIRHLGFSHPLITGLLISNVCFILAAYVLCRLLKLDYSLSVVKWTLIALMAFPVSFYFSSVYTESLFFLLVVSSLYSARKNHWLLAGLLGGLAAYTRLAGILLVPALVVELLYTESKSLTSWLSLLLVPMGLLVFMLFLNSTIGDPFAFMHVQKLFGQNRSDTIILLYQVFWRYGKMVATIDKSTFSFLVVILELMTGIVFLITSIAAFFKIRPSYALFGFLAFILPTLTGTFASLPRYVLICFPSFLLIGLLIHKTRSLVKTMYLVSSLAFMFIFLSLFSRGFWVS